MSMSSCGAGSSSPDAPRSIKRPVSPLMNAPPDRGRINRTAPMARQAFVVNDAMRERVRYLAGVGVRQDDIVKIIGCAPQTLRKRFRDELDRGVAEANATVCGYLFAAAKAGNIPAIIFWAQDAGAVARRTSAGRPAIRFGARGEVRGGSGLARQHPRSR